jgi:hypothetical protein
MSPASCLERQQVDRHFEGTIGPDAEHALREHLPTCADCTGYYERHLLLAKLDPQSLDAQSRLARGLGLRAPGKVAPWAFGVVGFAAAAAVALLVLSPTVNRGFTPRGTGAPAPGVHLSVFRLEHGAALAVKDRIDAADELAFTYENAAGKERLMIFGVDEHGHVYWFFPAWQDPATDPEALRIDRTERPRELREAVAHSFDGRQLTLHALFTDEPLTVREVERRLAKSAAPLSPGALEESLAVSIERGGRR